MCGLQETGRACISEVNSSLLVIIHYVEIKTFRMNSRPHRCCLFAETVRLNTLVETVRLSTKCRLLRCGKGVALLVARQTAKSGI